MASRVRIATNSNIVMASTSQRLFAGSSTKSFAPGVNPGLTACRCDSALPILYHSFTNFAISCE